MPAETQEGYAIVSLLRPVVSFYFNFSATVGQTLATRCLKRSYRANPKIDISDSGHADCNETSSQCEGVSVCLSQFLFEFYNFKIGWLIMTDHKSIRSIKLVLNKELKYLKLKLISF